MKSSKRKDNLNSASTTEQIASRWQKLLAWLAAFEGAINYDPQADIDATITQLRKVVARLETRMTEMEGRHQRILPLVVTDVVDSPQPGWMP